ILRHKGDVEPALLGILAQQAADNCAHAIGLDVAEVKLFVGSEERQLLLLAATWWQIGPHPPFWHTQPLQRPPERECVSVMRCMNRMPGQPGPRCFWRCVLGGP